MPEFLAFLGLLVVGLLMVVCHLVTLALEARRLERELDRSVGGEG